MLSKLQIQYLELFVQESFDIKVFPSKLLLAFNVNGFQLRNPHFVGSPCCGFLRGFYTILFLWCGSLWGIHTMGNPFQCERLKSQNSMSTELEADWQSWWSCRQLPLHINSCYEAAGWVYCILSSEVLELLC